MLEINKVYNEDCIGERGMMLIADGSVDMVLCDLPYGTTSCSWDSVIDLDELWKHYKRIVKPNGAIVLTASQPFTSALIMSNPKMFRYEWIWDKVKPSGHLNAKIMPMKQHESVVIFGKSKLTYKPIMTPQEPRISKNYLRNKSELFRAETKVSRVTSEKYPKSILTISNASQVGKVHPTQKPVALGEYLIRTYTNEGDIVLDNTCGVGSFPVAAVNTGRNFIGFELDSGYYEIAVNRVAEAMKNVV